MNTQALQQIGYGMYIVTSKKGEQLNGQVANTVFQITSEPPTVAVSINKKNLTHEFIKESRGFAASILCQETPLSFIGRFGFKSGRDTSKLEGINYRIGKTGAPIVTDYAVAYVEARVIKEVDMGTHTIFIGEVVDADTLAEKVCMTYDYYRQIKRGTTPQTAPSYVPERREAKPQMAKYRCAVCGWIYDPEVGDPDGGIKPGTPFEQLSDSWVCPVCGADKTQFEKI